MTNIARDWLTDDFPELRDGPPWVMEEMITAQRRLAAPILGADRVEVTRLRDAVADAAGGGDPVVVTGCGISEHAAAAVAELLTDSFRRAGLTTARAEGAPGTGCRARPARRRPLPRDLARRRDQRPGSPWRPPAQAEPGPH